MRKWWFQVNKQLAKGLLMSAPESKFHLLSHPLKKGCISIDLPGPFVQNRKVWFLLIGDFLILSILSLFCLSTTNLYSGSETLSQGNTELLLLNSTFQASIFQKHTILLFFAMLFCNSQSFFHSANTSSTQDTERKAQARCGGEAKARQNPNPKELQSTDVDWFT